MDIMELGAIGELVGGVAVIASLIFVGVQVRNSTREQQTSSMREAARALLGGVQSIQQPGIAEIWLQGMQRFEALNPGDRLRFAALLLHLLRMFEQLYHQHRSRNVETDLWEGFDRQLCDWVTAPGFGGWWAARGHWLSEEFRAYVETRMREHPQSAPYSAFSAGGARNA